MGKIVVSENVSLDGVVQDPTGDGALGRGDWFDHVGDKDRQEWAKLLFDEAAGSEAMLLGRRTYEWFAARWPSRTGAYADRLNSMPKHVVSTTLKDPDWNNSTVLEGDAVTAVTRLKSESSGDVVVYGSGRLVHTLIEHDLVDEVRLIVFPLVVGVGERLFGETSGTKPLRLIGTRAIGDGLTGLAYRSVRDA